jgi:hypothetical protein
LIELYALRARKTDHKLMEKIENMLEMIIDRTEGERGRARQDHHLLQVLISAYPL